MFSAKLILHLEHKKDAIWISIIENSSLDFCY